MAAATYILGINAYHGDASAVLMRDGQIVAAVEEERFNRVKHSAGFPLLAIRYCLLRAGIKITDVAHIGISRVPSAHLINKITFVLYNRLMFTHQGLDRLRSVEKVRNLKTVLAESLGIREADLGMEFHNVEHHVAHMASSFLVSPFETAAVLSIDGFGDFCSTMLGSGSGTKLEKIESIMFPHSLGLFYTSMTQYLGFQKYGDEGKVMGLAPYGEPRYLDRMLEIVQPDGHGGFHLNLEYFTHHTRGVEMSWDEGSPHIGRVYSDKFFELLGPARQPFEEITQHHRDVAASMQKCLEIYLFRILNQLYRYSGSTNLCLSGGVAYNSVANGLIRQNTPFREVFIQPAAGDSGTALGVAFYIWNTLLGNPRGCVMADAYLGPEYSESELAQALHSFGITYERCEDIEERAADLLAAGKIVGWFQGRMEFGPRALGNRSILADPRQPEMKDVLNRRIKHRESFRPFAPAVLEEYVEEYFENSCPSPFMLMVFKVRPEKRPAIPATEHVDHTGRVQSVSKSVNPKFWNLIDAFRRRTGIPLVLNTSFNENEPIVCSPQDALHCYATTKMDALVLENFLITR
ncbi:MAG TPA: carbamoyltransferase [Acidobacteriota bacterium]|nr:carbamoyltransferase [Acidobacteriota bacterium]